MLWQGISIIILAKNHQQKQEKKMSDSRMKHKKQIGYLISPEARKKMSIFRKGKPSNVKGKHWKWKLSKEAKRKIGLTHKGDKCNFWKGGVSFEPYSTDWTDDLRDSIRKRDNYICQECGVHQDELNNWSKKLDIHHIDYNKKNCNPNNLTTLCRNCHTKTNGNRNYWIKYFNNN